MDEQGKVIVNIGFVKVGKMQICVIFGNVVMVIVDVIIFEVDCKIVVIKIVEVKGDNKLVFDGFSFVSYVMIVVDVNGNLVGGMILSWDSNINKIVSQIIIIDING